MRRNMAIALGLSAFVLITVSTPVKADGANKVCSATSASSNDYKGRFFPNRHINSSESLLNESVPTVYGCHRLCETHEGCIALSFSSTPATNDNCMLYNLFNIQKYISPKPGHTVILLLPMECGENSTADGGWSSWEQSNDCWTPECQERRRCNNPKRECNGDKCLGDDQRLARIRPLTDLGMMCNLTEEGIYPFNLSGEVFDALVTMSPNEQASIVIQRRYDGGVDFTRMWDEYKRGFGNLSGEFWLGNDIIHLLTSAQQSVSLKIELNDGTDDRYAVYSGFEVANEDENYKLTPGSYTGDAGDSFQSHDGMMFTTKDRDNDEHTGNCAKMYQGGGWWFTGKTFTICARVNLNGRYPFDGRQQYTAGIIWHAFHSYSDLIRTSEMKITVCG